MTNSQEIGWVLIYLFAFGMNDCFVKTYIHNEFIQCAYYIILGCIGFYILSKRSKHFNSETD